MEKIEEVTCIKFENRTKNDHQERFFRILSQDPVIQIEHR